MMIPAQAKSFQCSIDAWKKCVVKAENICVIRKIENPFVLHVVEHCVKARETTPCSVPVQPLNTLIVHRRTLYMWTSISPPNRLHESADISVFPSVIGANTRRYPIPSCTVDKGGHDSFCSIIRCTFQKNHKPWEAVNTPVNHKPPTNKFVLSIYLP